MASEKSGDDHAQATPKTESLCVPVFWHHIPGTWVSVSVFLLLFFFYLADTFAGSSHVLFEFQRDGLTAGNFTGKHLAPSDPQLNSSLSFYQTYPKGNPAWSYPGVCTVNAAAINDSFANQIISI